LTPASAGRRISRKRSKLRIYLLRSFLKATAMMFISTSTVRRSYVMPFWKTSSKKKKRRGSDACLLKTPKAKKRRKLLLQTPCLP